MERTADKMMRYVGKRFFLEEEVGRRTLTTVFRALDLENGQPVTVRRFHSRFGDDPRFALRFREHLKTLIALDHENLVKVLDYGLIGGDYYIASEEVDGMTLATYLAEKGAIDPPVAVHVILQICAAVAELHDHGLLHRGLRSEDIFLTSNGSVKVAKAGLTALISESGLSRTHVMLDGIGYMSPEQARGEPIRIESDVYSIGVLLFELLTGRLPFESGDSWSIVRWHAEESPPPVRGLNPLVQPELAEIVEKSLQKRSDARFNTIEALMAALAPLPQSELSLQGGPILSGRSGAGTRRFFSGLVERRRRYSRRFRSHLLAQDGRNRPVALLLSLNFVGSFAVAFLLLWFVTGAVIGSAPRSSDAGAHGSGSLNRAISRPLPTPTLAPTMEPNEASSNAGNVFGISGEESPAEVESIPDSGPPIYSGSPSQGGGPPDHAGGPPDHAGGPKKDRGPNEGRGPKPGRGPGKDK